MVAVVVVRVDLAIVIVVAMVEMVDLLMVVAMRMVIFYLLPSSFTFQAL